MKCPTCSHPDSRVVDSRTTKEGNAIRRRRECESCSHRFTTYERAEVTWPLIVKKDGSRGNYDREKIRLGIQKALEKRPVPAEEQEAIVDRIERFVLDTGEKEISTSAIGEKVMDELRETDQVAYVRFASVYRSFGTVKDFEEELQKLDKARS
ncbi:MAG: transcriptional repressor NrdR [Nitrospinaceae bacterium]|jgi:transcriptional repressor NrdR|nr:transcriptional repressor NrdR [Nitrospinaceae bacterium]MBT3435227.1 transcriptional repressor NrdR [Nitrospinaceae bacterium]MBT4094813.1 transcriptional repressor NrdR [Nitrospinaceae bacterium]MBT4429172.1 transcriptional repressor NrdR [Nitrospinaceae bacterium]MBT5368969.1 transcriptional repressor NrdR [Nitrospinaceae bacterium]